MLVLVLVLAVAVVVAAAEAAAAVAAGTVVGCSSHGGGDVGEMCISFLHCYVSSAI